MWMVSVYKILLFLCLYVTALSYSFSRCRKLQSNILSTLRQIHRFRIYINPEDDNIPESIQITNFTGSGCVVVIHSGDYDHFLMKQAVFIFKHDEKGSQGVILSKLTAFTMGEVSPSIGPFASNPLFMGGNDGTDMAIMLHRHELNGRAKYVGSGIYLGGLREAQEFVKEGRASPKEFKFFFNTVDWAAEALEKEIEQGRWTVIRAPPDFIIGPSSSNLWSLANNLIVSQSIATHTKAPVHHDNRNDENENKS